MGGGGGGSPFRDRSPEALTRLVRQEESKEFGAELSQLLGNLLSAYNGRDVPLVAERLSDILDHLKDTVEGEFDVIFGGSVAKHTHVDGLSDVDTLLVINETKFEGQSPSQVLASLAKILRQRLPEIQSISHGQLALTVEYKDAMVIQLLPALRFRKAVKIPSANSDSWSSIDPLGFKEALTKRNEQCGRKLIPTIKLAKAIIGTLPESRRLTGYHIESLAVAAFKNYEGQKTTAAMLPTFFESARGLVLQPIKDSTGQSVHVDEYLGPAGSESRMRAAHILGQIGKRMRNATGAQSTEQWKELFELSQ